MISPTTAAHIHHAGLSLRLWRDQTLAATLIAACTPRAHRIALWATWIALIATGSAAVISKGVWYPVFAVVIMSLAIWWMTNRASRPILDAEPPWWGLTPLAFASWWLVPALIAGVATGWVTDTWLRTKRHTSMRAGGAAALAAVAWAVAGGGGAFIAGTTSGALLARSLYRLKGSWPRKMTTPPPPDLPLLASMKWERLVSRTHSGRAEPFYATLEKLLGRDTPAARQVAIKQEGLAAELMSAQALSRLPRGYRVIHDLSLPGARSANIDHLIVGPTGVIVVDTKAYGSSTHPVGVGFASERFVYQDAAGVIRDLSAPIVQVLWATREVSLAMGEVPARAVMLIHHADVQAGLIGAAADHSSSTITLTDADHLVEAVTSTPVGLDAPWSPQQVKEVCGHAHQVLSAADGAEIASLRTVGRARPLSGAVQAPPLLLYPSGGGRVDPVPAPAGGAG